MNKLIILLGDSGCGKTNLIRLLIKFHGDNIAVIKKYSDRDARQGEENAIEIQPGSSTEYVKAMDYVYTGHNNKVYGFYKKDVDDNLKQGKSPVVIIDDENILVQLCNEYIGRVCPVYMQRDTTDLEFIEELRKGNRTEEQIRQRIDSRHKKQDLWRRRSNLFGYRYIINGQFLDNEGLLGWFEKIAIENDIDIGENTRIDRVKGIINYFRHLWKDRPTIMISKVGAEPIIEEQTENNER